MLLALAACHASSPPDSPGTSTFSQVTAVVCADTTAVGVVETSPDGVVVTGSITEVGALLPVDGSHPLGGFAGCDQQAHQVRIVDDAGDTWTFGWDLDGAVDDDSTAAFAIGADLTARAIWVEDFTTSLALLLSDAAGPLMLEELGASKLDPADRGDLEVDVHYDRGVLATNALGERIWVYPATFSGPHGSVDLEAGADGDVRLADRTLTVHYGGAWEIADTCFDGCSNEEWTAWEAP